MHGKTSMIHHDGNTLFRGLPNPSKHTVSLSRNKRETLPDCLDITAWTEAEAWEIIMVCWHQEASYRRVQFHPESILTVAGKDLLRNSFASACRITNDTRSDQPCNSEHQPVRAETPNGINEIMEGRATGRTNRSISGRLAHQRRNHRRDYRRSAHHA